MTRTELLNLDEARLQSLCRIEVCRGTGPGGQKRNKTSSAVHVTHLETQLAAFDDQERSQQINKHRALQKLRLEFALKLREPAAPWTEPVPGQKSERYILWIAALLDNLYQYNFILADASAAFGSSTGKIVREMAKTPALWQLVNKERTTRDLPVLKVN